MGTIPADAVVEVESFSSEGHGVARLPDGRVVFVEGGVPGDRATLADVEEKKRFVRARIATLEDPSDARVEPRCPHFGECGGCLWQHVDYSAQLEAKRKAVGDALQRIGGLALERPIEIVASPSPYGYRGRARWVECEGGVGYRVRGGEGARAVDVCPVLAPGAEAALAEQGEAVRARASEAAPGRRRREWVVTTGSDGDAIITPAGSRKASRRAKDTKQSVVVDVTGSRLRVSGESFVQANVLLWDALVDAVVAACLGGDIGPGSRFVELHAGVGFFTLPLAAKGLVGAAVESDGFAVGDLRANLREAGASQMIEVVAGRAETRRDLPRRLAGADLVLVDPPRTGLEKPITEALLEATPPRLVYLSCDPGTLARDLGLLAAAYEVTATKAFDLFPQTPHVETLATLERTRR